MFALIVAFLGGVVTGAMVLFFTRGPLVAYFRLEDEPPQEPIYVASGEVYGPSRRVRRRQVCRSQPWQRVASTPTPAAVAESTRRLLDDGGGVS